MSVAFYADEHFPGPVLTALRQRGIDVLSVQEDGGMADDDEQVLLRAKELDRVLLTQDQDFFVIAARWQVGSIPFPGIFYARQLGLSYRRLIEEISIAGLAGLPEDFQNRIEFLPLHLT